MTRTDLELRPVTGRPMCMGSGFVALDMIEGRHGDIATVGGSCGNVMSILSWMGWDAKMVGRLRDDIVGEYIKHELDLVGVDTAWLAIEVKGESPIVVQKFVQDESGQRLHRYSLTCPDCKGWLPRFRPTTVAHANSLIDSLEPPMAYYFDRTAPAILRLAQWARENGALVVFEPSSIGDEGRFQRAVDLCHVLKFSDERLGNVRDLLEAESPKIIVQTAGADGLGVRWKGRWSKLTAYKAPVLEDAAGSGDWCSAALIHMLAVGGVNGLSRMRKADLDTALRFGQALAAINCGFEGARGAMMALSREDMARAIKHLASRHDVTKFEIRTWDYSKRELPPASCFICSGGKVKTFEKLSA